MEKSYLTIAKNSQTEIVEKKSSFIATVAKCDTEQDCLKHINYVRSKYPDARHNVYAYSVLNEGVNVMRYSDDGEPKGTAGVPVLDAIQKSGVTNICVVVTRYFGGILLGASGLTRTYSNAATEGIKASGVQKMIMAEEIIINCTYDMYGKIIKVFEKYSIIENPPEFLTDITLKIVVPLDTAENIIKDITDVTSACFSYKIGEKGFYNIE